ncbi:MAG: alkaline phosphatase family protein [Phenylobacterium sp.]|uniref:alkaline phosphatase family protein n=1 Tax=Phenylobacterium sp. TaxID=1871053 RepID=UPI001228858A|nr:ectonucleotide pyrophosphatase/phosphodiesterase [Phenylobacterium sp.]TAJ70534.1 MAG: alkaline phosphatase family protein [Phenylobacterium sp.]
MLRLIAVLAAVLLAACATTPMQAPGGPPVILVSIDGFRPDYLDRGVTPVLSGLAAAGVRAAMRPSFPSKTFPNHYALVTGLRPDRNGIVENTFEDPRWPGETFRMSNRKAVQDRRWWDEGEPIWVTAERAGIVTAPAFWPGAEAPIQGVRPRHFLVFDMATPNEVRVDRLLALLDLPAPERPRFLTLYFDTVDTAGHDFGPDSPELNDAVGKVDAQIGRLVEGLEARRTPANLIVVADHGMAQLSPDRTLYMDDHLPGDAYRYLTRGAFMTIYPAPGREHEVASALLKAHDHFRCWAKADIPAPYHYGKNPRAAPFFCQPDTGWTLTTRDYKPSEPELGSHGFDPYSPEMAAVFVANGPAFRPGVTLPTFDNVSVYPLLARLLRVKPEPNDGKPDDLQTALTR